MAMRRRAIRRERFAARTSACRHRLHVGVGSFDSMCHLIVVPFVKARLGVADNDQWQ